MSSYGNISKEDEVEEDYNTVHVHDFEGSPVFIYYYV